LRRPLHSNGAEEEEEREAGKRPEPAGPAERSSRSQARVSRREERVGRRNVCEVGRPKVGGVVAGFRGGGLMFFGRISAARVDTEAAVEEAEAEEEAAAEEADLVRDDEGPLMILERNLTSFWTGRARVDWAMPAPAPARPARRVGWVVSEGEW
jgi:hypothetical protein